MTELKELTKEIRSQREVLNQIKSAIQGNDELGQKGLKHVIEDHGKRIADLERFRNNQERSDDVKKATEGNKLFKARLFGLGAGASAAATAMAPKSMWGKIGSIISSWFS